MTGSIILNSNNLSDSGTFSYNVNLAPYNTLRQNLQGCNLVNRQIALKKLSLYYSWPNIVNATSITVSWKVASTFTNTTFTLPSLTNYDSISTLNQALQNHLIANKMYLIDNNGDNVYYAEFVENPITYKCSLNLYLVPTSLPSGFSSPSGFLGYPTVSCTQKITISSTGNDFAELIGFAQGTYDGNTSQIQYNSTYVPQLSPTSCIYVTCNLCKNDIPINGSATVINTFTTAGRPYGSMVLIEDQFPSFYEIDVSGGVLEVCFYDQNWNKLQIQDPQISILLLIK